MQKQDFIQQVKTNITKCGHNCNGVWGFKKDKSPIFVSLCGGGSNLELLYRVFLGLVAADPDNAYMTTEHFPGPEINSDYVVVYSFKRGWSKLAIDIIAFKGKEVLTEITEGDGFEMVMEGVEKLQSAVADIAKGRIYFQRDQVPMFGESDMPVPLGCN